MNSYDAIVIGAGPAGSTAALLLARAGWSVAIVEGSEFPRRKVCGEFISAPALSLLARAGVADDIVARAGPEITEVAVYAGERVVTGNMPRGAGDFSYGRALGREHLDAILLDAARREGAVVWQPWRAKTVACEAGLYVCSIERKGPHQRDRLHAPVFIAAHGSSDTLGVHAPPTARPAAPSDLFGFKAHFTASRLSAVRMPLIAFPGGYGGLVTSDSGRTSLSCCIRRDALAACRAETPGGAGPAVLAHILGSCRGAREVLGDAERAGAWLAAGPLRPGVHAAVTRGYFAVGNAMGEAHPVVAEGISMAIQSAWLLCERLIVERGELWGGRADAVSASYVEDYRRSFGGRINASFAFAFVAMHRPIASAVAGLLETMPGLMSLGAQWAGKAKPLAAGA